MSVQKEALARYDSRVAKVIDSLPWYAIYAKDRCKTAAENVREDLSELWAMIEEIKNEYPTRQT